MNDELNALAIEYHEYRLQTSPDVALMIGDHRYDELMRMESREAEDVHIGRLRAFAARAEAIDPATLEAQDRISREVLVLTTTTEAAHTETRPSSSKSTPPSAFIAASL